MIEKHAFLASEFSPAAAEAARFHVIPAPMELSVSYGGGAAAGPAAILAASQQLEALDAEGRLGAADVHTQSAVSAEDGAEAWVAAIEARAAQALRAGAVPVVLGGEHTVTFGAARAFHAAGRRVGFVHFDAHADLRDTYEHTPLSHACVMRRVHELGFPCLQFGTRAVSQEEYDYRAAHPATLTAYDARVIAAGGLPQGVVPEGFPEEVYVTFDVDAFDPSLMPATGTPVPGGFMWFDAMRILREVAAARRIAGLDIVELAPAPGLHHADFTAALLTQTLIGFAREGKQT